MEPAARPDAMPKRRRIKQLMSLKERLAAFAEEMREKATHAKVGAERDEFLRKARQAETASHADEWANSPGLQPPK
jgi:hypothetical protein